MQRDYFITEMSITEFLWGLCIGICILYIKKANI